jgi:hypothetical protein
MWNKKQMTIPAITGATRIVKKVTKNFGSHTRKTFNRFTTKTAIFGTSHIIWKVLQTET